MGQPVEGHISFCGPPMVRAGSHRTPVLDTVGWKVVAASGKAELYQVGLGAAALRALSHMAALNGKNQVSSELAATFSQQKVFLNQMFWSEEKGSFAFALDVKLRTSGHSQCAGHGPYVV